MTYDGEVVMLQKRSSTHSTSPQTGSEYFNFIFFSTLGHKAIIFNVSRRQCIFSVLNIPIPENSHDNSS
jgi:hypothetical protein